MHKSKEAEYFYDIKKWKAKLVEYSHIGEVFTTKYGLTATCVAYHNKIGNTEATYDLFISDGTYVYDVNARAIKFDEIPIKGLSLNSRNVPFHGYYIKGKAIYIDDTALFNCIKVNTNEEYVLTVNDMLNDTVIEYPDIDAIKNRLLKEIDYYSPIGKKLVTKDGYECTIIKYDKSKLTVHFSNPDEDKVVDKFKAFKGNFTRNGIYSQSKVNERIGYKFTKNGVDYEVISSHKKKQNNGKLTTVYTIKDSNNNIYDDIYFQNIPKMNFRTRNAERLIGTSNLMNCGLYATITEYINNQDITVEFEDGIIVKHTRLDTFRKGKIPHKVQDKSIEL